MRGAILVLVTWWSLAPGYGEAQQPEAEVRCEYSGRFHCDRTGCEELPFEEDFIMSPPPEELQVPGGLSLLHSTPKVRVCDTVQCIPIPVSAVLSGVSLHVSSAGGGYMWSFFLSSQEVGDTYRERVRRGDFTEVRNTFRSTTVSFGSCPW